MSPPSPRLVQSVHDRLVRLAHERDIEPNLVFSRFAAERLLYRLSASRHADRFVLKGAFLLVVWLGEVVRPTRGFGDLPAEALVLIRTGRSSRGPTPSRQWYSSAKQPPGQRTTGTRSFLSAARTSSR